MDDENDRTYVRSSQIPEWMASGLGKIAPLAIVSTVGAGLLLWVNAAILDTRVQRLESLTGTGERFSARDGATLAERIKELEHWQRAHDAYRYETMGKWTQKLTDIEHRLRAIENGHLANGYAK